MEDLKLDDLINPKGLKYYDLPITKKRVYYRSLSYGETIKMTKEEDRGEKEMVPCLVVSMTTYDSKGKRIFKDAKEASMLPMDEIQALFDKVQDETNIPGSTGVKKKPQSRS
jgi:hypothetical protein